MRAIWGRGELLTQQTFEARGLCASERNGFSCILNSSRQFHFLHNYPLNQSHDNNEKRSISKWIVSEDINLISQLKYITFNTKWNWLVSAACFLLKWAGMLLLIESYQYWQIKHDLLGLFDTSNAHYASWTHTIRTWIEYCYHIGSGASTIYSRLDPNKGL